MAAESPSRTLRVKDAAAEYGLTERHVRQLVADKAVTYYKVGRAVLIDRADLERIFDEGLVEASN